MSPFLSPSCYPLPHSHSRPLYRSPTDRVHGGITQGLRSSTSSPCRGRMRAARHRKRLFHQVVRGRGGLGFGGQTSGGGRKRRCRLAVREGISWKVGVKERAMYNWRRNRASRVVRAYIQGQYARCKNRVPSCTFKERRKLNVSGCNIVCWGVVSSR